MWSDLRGRARQLRGWLRLLRLPSKDRRPVNSGSPQALDAFRALKLQALATLRLPGDL